MADSEILVINTPSSVTLSQTMNYKHLINDTKKYQICWSQKLGMVELTHETTISITFKVDKFLCSQNAANQHETQK